jgi:lysyl-tRNA synthetase class 2
MERKFNEQELIKRNKLKTLIEQEYDPFKITNFKRTHNSNSFKKEFGEFSKEELHSNTSNIVLAGRVMSIRQTFGGVQDYFGKFQFYINKKNHPELFSFFSKHVDLGDILGLEGTPMKTNTGELTLNVNKMLILSKSLKPLPEK